MSLAVHHPEVLWAQRSSDSDESKNILYITVNLPDIDESSLDYNLTRTSISFNANAGDDQEEYAFYFDFYAEVVPELSSKRLTSRSFILVLRKKEKQVEYWPRLTKEKAKLSFLKTDFSKWVDEDEQDDGALEDDMDMEDIGDMGFEKMMAHPGETKFDDDDDDS